MTVKEAAKQVIDALPEDASLDDVMQALYVHAKFQHGEQQIREGKGVPHEQAKRELEKWVK